MMDPKFDQRMQAERELMRKGQVSLTAGSLSDASLQKYAGSCVRFEESVNRVGAKVGSICQGWEETPHLTFPITARM